MSKEVDSDLVKNGGTPQFEVFQKLAAELPKERLAWLAGYFSGQAEVNQKLADLFQNLDGKEATSNTVVPTNLVPVMEAPVKKEAKSDPKVIDTKTLTILYGSHSGNSTGVAKQAKEMAQKKGYVVKLKSMADYKTRDLKKEQNLLVIVSTYGKGVPPFAAEELHEFIHSSRAPKLNGLNYSVLALGDKSYFHFCKTGIEFDTKLEDLGAKRLYKRVDCDVNFKLDAGNWLSGSLEAFDALYSGAAEQEAVVEVTDDAVGIDAVYNEDNPFGAEILKKIKLNGRGSQKETYHIELLIEGSGIKYQPGDSVAVKAANSDELVKQIIDVVVLSGNEKVQTKRGRVDLKDALKRDFELTVLSSDTVRKHNDKAKNSELTKILENEEDFKEFISENDVLDLLKKYPVEYRADELVNILRPLSARLYSIASSQQTYEDELHITVGAVRYNSNGRNKEGVCSTYFADRLNEGDIVEIYVKPNEGFRLPKDNKAPVIMVGAGTGVAPYRAFVDERASANGNNENWLIFGNQHFLTDFLYQTEWQAHLKSGALTKMNVAFSRDQEEKIYVQNKILQNSREIYQWLNNGAYIYVCGDKERMANDVYNAFVEVVHKEAGLTQEESLDFVKNMKRKGKYQEDVY